MRFFNFLPVAFCLGVQALPAAERQHAGDDGPKVIIPHSTVKVVPVADPKDPILPRDEDPKPILTQSSAVEKDSPANPIKTILPRDGVPKPILPQSKVEAATPGTPILPRKDVPTILPVSRIDKVPAVDPTKPILPRKTRPAILPASKVEKVAAADPTKPILPTLPAQLEKREHITVTIEKELDKLGLTLDSTVKQLSKKLGLKAADDDTDKLLSGLVGNVDGVLNKVDKIVSDLLTDLGLDGLNETIEDIEKALGLSSKNTIRKLLRSLHLL